MRRPDVPLDDLWRTDTDACCAARKVAPLEEALAGQGRRGCRGCAEPTRAERADTPIVERDRRGLVKVNPIATWTDDDVDLYISLHDVPVNPLVAQGYPSVGCWPCTQIGGAG